MPTRDSGAPDRGRAMSTAHTGSTQEATTASATMDGPDHPVTAALAEFVTTFDLSAVDPAVVAAAKVLILDGLGCLVAGANHPVAGILLRYADEIGGRGSCTLLSRGDRTNAPLAAFVHGAMLHVNDYEPQGAIPMHGTSNLLPPALAVAEQNGRDGSELLAAVIVGWEVQSRLRGSGPRDLGGFHPPGMFGPFGAAAASGRLLGLSSEQVAMAFGIAGSRTGGLFANNGTMVKSTHPGNAGRMGTEAALLAQLGFISNPDIIDAPRGFASTVFKGDFHPEKVLDGLADARLLVDPGYTIKRFPAEVNMQRVLEACVSLKQKANLSADDIDHLEIELSDVRPDLSRLNPKSGLDGKFSYEYCAAVAFAEDRVGLHSFTDHVRFSPEVEEMLGRVKAVGNDAIPRGLHDTWVVARAYLRDGSVVEEKCKEFKGSPANPMSREERLAKFSDCVSDAWSDEQQATAIESVEHLEETGCLERVFELLRAVP
jgi:2-methylcitrate dehydratase PrpD